ncbi:hypothetical protein N1027_00265 [Herbiconiux sp. CPCC 205763]|uniref:Histidine kinase n=1 Tax=Herbiconiux aconitum TaxID=2970913 RepID=A0ABT2GP82_9MICO|nr:hypothetical protein [Herbiconiux aconitum]MCS5716566.1 hypothetical protein [Herbiconiux aconitum]
MSDDTNDRPTRGEPASSGRPELPKRPALLVLLAVIVGAEALVMAGVVLWLVVELMTVRPTSYETAVAILVLAAIAAVFLGFVAVHILRARSWTRAATLTWQLLQVVIAIGCFQGMVATPTIGWYLLLPAVLAIILLFTPPVVAATRRDV